ncbi:cytochrome c-type biogenesis protein CcmH [Prauserella sp. PE36]|uniref:cytochrome c-type biogenesis protein n=1 Tax=Prauserella sp. PE36 TaxID=1504709 RepID=UPI001F2DE11E|nr:cytochrome c-type biogenesis protein CcmH [Prauserella sp. PE36]
MLAIVALVGLAVGGLLTAGPGTPDRAYELEQRLRCPVCKSVSIAESPAETAEAMRAVVADQVAAGRGDQEIIDYFRARYGDWVLLDPPASGSTLALWMLPVAAVVVGGVALALLRRRPDAVDEVTSEDRIRVRRAVDQVRSRVADGDMP